MLYKAQEVAVQSVVKKLKKKINAIQGTRSSCTICG